jgi:signal transduction histidine kinase
MLDSMLCQSENPTFLRFFDLSTAPSLLFYSYIPIIFVALFFGFFVFHQDQKSLQGKLLLGISAFFSLWIINILAQWTASYHTVLMFAWQLTALLEVPIFLFSLYFIYVFIYKKDLNFIYKLFLFTVIFSVCYFLPTIYNITSYNSIDCEGNLGSLWDFIYLFEILAVFLSLLIGAIGYKAPNKKVSKNEVLLVTIGMTLFLGFFSISNILGEVTQIYEINLFGPLGMILFLSLMSYLIVRYKTFNTKILGAQVLIFILTILIFSLLFIKDDYFVRAAVTYSTLALIIIIGYYLIRGVKLEVEQREKIEKLAVELKDANVMLKELDRQKDAVVHMVAHQFKGPVTTINFTTELLLDGSFGNLTDEQKENLATIRTASQKMGAQSDMVLDAAKITAGKLPLEPAPVDLKALFKEIVSEAENHAKEKKVNLKVSLPKELPTVILDKKYTQLSIDNLLSNAVKYTALKSEGGNVEFIVEIKNKTLLCTVRDTGIGIPEKDQENVFKELYRASNAGKDGNGLGLHVAVGAIEAQGGKIRFESTENVGTTFFVELPLKPV